MPFDEVLKYDSIIDFLYNIMHFTFLRDSVSDSINRQKFKPYNK